jgi:DNA-binding CsgD family transcriptional regulator/tetratricopeptide (TPR) repeat protein
MLEAAGRIRRFVARQDEFETLASRRRSAARGSGSVVVVSGEAGIGKTSLLQRFLDADGRRSPRTVRAECLACAQRTLGPWRTIVAALTDAHAPELDDVAAQAVAFLAPSRAVTARDDSLGKAGLFAAVARLLWDVAAKRTTILAIEDVHWADVATIELLAYIAARVRKMRLLVVATLRDGEPLSADANAALARLLREPTTTHVALEPLSDAALRELLFAGGEPPPSLRASQVAALLRRAEGNPLFAEELLRDARSRETGSRAVPISIRALVDETHRRLPEDVQRVVRQAAVLGKWVDPALLAEVIEEPRNRVVGALLVARDAGLLVEEDGRRPRLRFRHALVREAIVAGLLDAQSAAMHERAALALERAPGDDRDLAPLAYHWWEAGNRAKVREYSERAGDAAYELKSYDDARMHFERALDVAATDGERARMLSKLGHAERAAGRSVHAVELYAEAFDRYRALADANGAAEVVPYLAVERSNSGASFGKMAGFLGDAEAEFGKYVDPVPLARLRAVRAQFLVFAGETDAALRTLEGVDSRLPLTPQVRVILSTVRMVAQYRRNDVAQWLRAADEVANVRVATDASTRINVASTAFGLAVTDRAIEELDDAVDIARRWRFGTALAHALFVRAYVTYACGCIGDARRDLDEALALQIESMYAEACFVGPLVSLASGDLETARRLADRRYIERERRDPSSDEWQKLSAIAALLSAADGDNPRGRATALAGVAALTSSYAAAVTLPIAAALVGPGDEQTLCEAATRVFGETTDAGRGTLALLRAVFAARNGDATAAALYGESARDAYESAGWHLFAAIATLCAGDVEAARARFAAMSAPGEWRRWSTLLSVPPAGAPSRPTLSPREHAVAQMIADGASNAEIAQECGVSRKTIEKHVNSIFAKLGVRSRTQIATFVATTLRSRPA